MHNIIPKSLVVLLLIIFIGGFLRFFRLGEFPVHLNHDEIAQLYDALSIAKTGRDIYGNFFPTIFKSVNDYKSPFYTYVTSLFIIFFGSSELIIRLPGAVFGTLIIPAVYFFTTKLLRNTKIAVFAAFVTAISPFEIFFSRKSFENGAGIFFMLVGFAFLLSEDKGYKRHVGFICLAIAMYTYFSHAILIPVMLALFLLIFKRNIFTRNSKQLILWVLLTIPLILIILLNPASRYRSKDVFVTQDVVLGEQLNFFKTNNAFLNFLSEFKVVSDYGFSRYLMQFDPAYLFSSGLDLTNHGPLGSGLLLLIQLPFLLLGVFYLVRTKNFRKEKIFILAWILVGMIPSGLTFESHSPHRSIMVFTMLNIISAVGIFSLGIFFNRKFIYPCFISGVIIAFLINLGYFLHIYFVDYPYDKSEYLHYPFKQVSLFAWSEIGNFDQIIFDPKFGITNPRIGTAVQYYIPYYGNYPPEKLQTDLKEGMQGEKISFSKFSIRKINWLSDKNLKNVLIIGSVWSLPIEEIEKEKIIKTFYFYSGEPAFYVIKV